jgi:putative transcriptional regulator
MTSHAGSFLVAKPVLQDPSFRQSVVLLLQHGTEGAFGLVVNRPTTVEDLPFPVYKGGPCSAPGLLMLHGQQDWAEGEAESEARAIAPGIFLGDAACLEKASDPPPGPEPRFRVFNGYAGWGPGQLEGELAAGAWWVVSADADVLFDTPAEGLWDRLIPPRIPEPSMN